MRAAQASLDAAKVKRDRYESIARSGAIPQNLLEEAQLEVQQQEQAVEAVRSRLERAKTALNPTDADILIATERIAQEHASGEANLAALNKEREALIQQHVEMSEQLERYTGELRQVETDLRHTTITATADGIITKLNLRNPGQTVRSGEEIAQIVPTNASLEVKAAVSPEERSKLKEGQRVQMRVSACPYPDYGVLEGVVSRISEDTIKPESNNGSPVAPFYEVAIDPSSRSLSRGENQCSIQAGMEGRVDIISREETVLKFLLRKARLLTDV